MDIFSHYFWAAAAAQAANKKVKKPLRIWLFAWWGLFPDLFAFTITFIWWVAKLLAGTSILELPRPDEIEPTKPDTIWQFLLAASLYNFSHSAIIFIIIFILVFHFLRRPVWEMVGWLFHILIDIPTHSYEFFPTPFLWPLSGWRFDGLSWDLPWFLVTNYLVLIIVYLLLFREKAKPPWWKRILSKFEN